MPVIMWQSLRFDYVRNDHNGQGLRAFDEAFFWFEWYNKGEKQYLFYSKISVLKSAPTIK